ncbi:hypothetical protein RIR_jg29271.t1 [Rhizophagus irregularis DAOM 181602=DAOM 197198]|nr:hypothetical protein RIR_jg29271.t1 [Rhizophagus irregularis DAOM 181602=DAOM 197198]
MKNGNDLGTVLKDLRKQQVTVLKISGTSWRSREITWERYWRPREITWERYWRPWKITWEQYWRPRGIALEKLWLMQYYE